jgi:hypothetical protein
MKNICIKPPEKILQDMDLRFKSNLTLQVEKLFEKISA